MSVATSNFASDPFAVSLTHHTFLAGPWKDAGSGAVLVTQLDDPESVVLVLKPEDVGPMIRALQHAGSPLAWCDDCQEWHAPRTSAAVFAPEGTE